MVMLRQLLGSELVVWDKGCTIRFKRPVTRTVRAEFHITHEMLAEVHRAVRAHGEQEFTWTVRYQEERGLVDAEFDKVLYVAAKDFYRQKKTFRALQTC